MRVHYIDVGQADATLLQLRKMRISRFLSTRAIGMRQMWSLIFGLKTFAISTSSIYHSHADHIGELDKIIEAFDVIEVWMNGQSSESDVFYRAHWRAIEVNGVDYYEPEVGEVSICGRWKSKSCTKNVSGFNK